MEQEFQIPYGTRPASDYNWFAAERHRYKLYHYDSTCEWQDEDDHGWVGGRSKEHAARLLFDLFAREHNNGRATVTVQEQSRAQGVHLKRTEDCIDDITYLEMVLRVGAPTTFQADIQNGRVENVRILNAQNGETLSNPPLEYTLNEG